MSDLSSNISKSFDLNDSDIEKEFAQIKGSGQNKSAVGRGSAATSSGPPQSGPRSNQQSVPKKSPKPIPKGIDFGENLIGNPRYFSKNNSPILNSEDAKYSSDVGSFMNNSNKNETWTRMGNNHNVQMSDSGQYSNQDKDEIISDSYSESQMEDDDNDMDSQNQTNENNRGNKNYNYPNHKAGMNNNVSYNKYQNMTQSELYAAKEEILLELEKLEDKGVRSEKKFTISSDLYEMERTYMRLKTKRDQTSAIKLMKKLLMGLVSGTEYINQKFNKNNIDLDGWSENVLLNITDYDEIFEELYDKYKTKFAVAPEIKLFITLIGSAFTFHMSKVFASKFSSNTFNAQTHSPTAANPPQTNENNKFGNQTQNGSFQTKSNQPGVPLRQKTSNINAELSRNMSNIFGSESKKQNKNNDDLDEIIKEMERNTNGLEIPDEDDGDGEFNEILSDDNQNEYTELEEIQNNKKKNLVL